MPKRSAGILMFRRRTNVLQLLLIHPGGPLWANKDIGAWSIPKGLYLEREDPLAAARREFAEETGLVPEGVFIELGDFKQPGGKIISAWAVEGDFDPRLLRSNLFTLEWPPHSGQIRHFPEADRAEWFDADIAARMVTKGQVSIVRALLAKAGLRDSGHGQALAVLG
jgi:predicted NUDIX family NTP pyrophosphohydrolase